MEQKIPFKNHRTRFEMGDRAPLFTGINENGEKIQLKTYRGKKVILFFYPRDSTPTCTVEACNLRDNYALLQEKGFEIIGISPDDANKHQKFIKKNNLPFPLIADTKLKIIKKYDVWGPKKFMGKVYDGLHRTTFVISEKGKIERVFKHVKSKIHTQQILASYEI